MSACDYCYALRAHGTKANDLTSADLETFLRGHLKNNFEVSRMPDSDSSFVVYHDDEEGGNFLISEHIFSIKGNPIKFSSTDCDHDSLDGVASVSEITGQLNISDTSSKQGSLLVESYKNVVMDDLKPFETALLYKEQFVMTLDNSELRVEHTSLNHAPLLEGPQSLVDEAQVHILKHLRNTSREQISILKDISDASAQDVLKVKIISSLEEKFKNDPVVFECQGDVIYLYSSDHNKLESIKKCVEENFYREFVALNDMQEFDFIEKHLKENIKMLTKSKDGVSIFMTKTQTSQGYTVVAFGNKLGFDESMGGLKQIIASFQRGEVFLNCTGMDEMLDLFIRGVQDKWKVTLIPEITASSSTSATLKGIMVSLVGGKIEDQNVDALVNSTGANLQLNSGQVSVAISCKAGPNLQNECLTKGPLTFGQVIETKAYNLACKSVFHCLGKGWNIDTSKDSQDILMNIVSTCLEMANKNSFTSVAFPPIACGVLKMPAKISAECILTAIENYPWTCNHTIKNINLVIYDKANIILKEFQQILNSKINKINSAWKRAGGLKITIISTSMDSINKAHNSLSKYK